MHRILLVEDSPESQLMVRGAVGNRIHVTAVSRASEAVAALQKEPFDLVILDVQLPDGDGFQLCAELRAQDRTRDIPIIFLTGRVAVGDRVTGLSLGADDYLVKPFHPLELRARVENKLKRMSERRRDEETVVAGCFRLHTSLQTVEIEEDGRSRTVELPPVEFRLLLHLARNEGRAFSREQLMTSIWGEDSELFDRVVDKHVSSLRQRLGPHGRHVRTVPRLGYSFRAALPARKSA